MSYVIYRRDKTRRPTFEVYFKALGATRGEWVDTFKTMGQARAWIKKREQGDKRPNGPPSTPIGTRIRATAQHPLPTSPTRGGETAAESRKKTS